MSLHLPPLLMTSEPGSFAQKTIVERKPQIIRQISADNGYPPGIGAALAAFQQEIARQPIQPLTGTVADVDSWNRAAAVYRGKTWLELPWYFAETFFYRRLLEAIRYFEPEGPWQGRDPFASQKKDEQQKAAAWWAGNWQAIGGNEPVATFESLLHLSLWGNRADLSNRAVREQVQGGLSTALERHNLLIDHTERVVSHLSTGVARVDWINDNVGLELLLDLALADFLLRQGWAERCVFHLKDQPFFVSDAMIQDVEETITLLSGSDLGARLNAHLAQGRLVLKGDPFWTGCLMFRQMPPSLRAELGQADLVILKGDVNYRRLLDDVHWSHTARITEIAAYFPAPCLVLRTLKGEIMIGLKSGQSEALASQDPTWLTNGKRGVIQLALPDHTEEESRKF